MNWSARGSDALASSMAKLWQDTENGLPNEQRLKVVAQSLSALAQELEAALEISSEPHGQGEQPIMLHSSINSANLADLAQKLYRNRRRRNEIFADETLFGEPAWDILLDLFVAGERGKRVAVTSACIGSGVPSTTALRWLNVLEMRGLVEREDDNQDARRSFVRLTAKGRGLMAEYFGSGCF